MALFNKQKQDKKKKGENVIGKIIYGFLLFMPLLSIGVTCMYAVFNKNAKDSYSDDYIYKEYVMRNTSEIQAEIPYTMTYKSLQTRNDTFYYTYIGLTAEELGITQERKDLLTKAVYYANDQRWELRPNDNSFYVRLLWNEETKPFEIIFDSANTTTTYTNILSIAYLTRTILAQNKLDNVFTYSIKKVEENELYNWAKTTGTYTVLNNVTTQIGITNTFIPMLMAYWLLISIIYFLYDIALILIWAVHDKIHELKDAI